MARNRILALAVVLLLLLVGAVVLVVTGQWAAALGAAGLGALAIGREVWALWQSRIVGWIDVGMRRLLSPFDRRYREFMLATARFVDLKGLATVGAYHPELDEVFIELSLAHRAPSQVPVGVLGQLPAEVTERHSVWDSLDTPEPRILAVLGVPGSGKTTLLRHIVRRLCHGRRPGARRTVPILLFLRDHVGRIVSSPEVTLLDLVRSRLGRLVADEPPGWFEQRLRNGDCVIMFDGLDEVGRPADRAIVHDWVEQQIQQYPDNDYVITARPLGYTHIEGARVLQVRAFTDDQVVRFVRSWSLVTERHAAPRGTHEDIVRQQADRHADDLLERLGAVPALYDLTVNPLLLTMIITVHRERGALPGDRTDLYNEICQVMLWRQQEDRRIDVGLSGRKKEVLLRRLAFGMMRQRVSDLPRDDVLAEFEEVRDRMSIELTPSEILADLRPHGILVQRENDQYSFAHQTFQEFLAAAHIRDKGLSTVLVDAVDDVWWRETTLLYVAMSDADPIMWACLDSGGNAALSLALDCADQCRELAPELRDRLTELLATLRAPDTEPEQRRDLTRAVVTRHLHQTIRTATGSVVCAKPIPLAIYRLYQQDIGGDSTGAIDDDAPVTGVRPREAVAFVHWVNDITHGKPGYRLPTCADLDDPAVQRALTTRSLSAWTTATNGRPELWAPADVDHPHTVDAATLRRYVRDDIERSVPTVARLLLLRAVVAVARLNPRGWRPGPSTRSTSRRCTRRSTASRVGTAADCGTSTRSSRRHTRATTTSSPSWGGSWPRSGASCRRHRSTTSGPRASPPRCATTWSGTMKDSSRTSSAR
ncbi:NACHT domain-containing protein [Actinophytocola gossypii]|uniref:NACHT domain-containing protein n=1 Tax=Actinophytocola gossypii TaxID=2812003 RepID=A0ABT2JC67_9PSEU|nr:NACHT domain-containing protein [Actinophytocola gossypii]MCT2585464.1 NACHT domain-containing protein [Actinophytocola gossypii]